RGSRAGQCDLLNGTAFSNPLIPNILTTRGFPLPVRCLSRCVYSKPVTDVLHTESQFCGIFKAPLAAPFLRCLPYPTVGKAFTWRATALRTWGSRGWVRKRGKKRKSFHPLRERNPDQAPPCRNAPGGSWDALAGAALVLPPTP